MVLPHDYLQTQNQIAAAQVAAELQMAALRQKQKEDAEKNSGTVIDAEYEDVSNQALIPHQPKE